MKKLIIGMVLVMLLLVPLACSKAPAPAPKAPPGATPVPAPTPGAVPPPSLPAALPSVAEERMIVRNGEMLLVVENVMNARDEIAQLAVKLGGYAVSSKISGDENEREGFISIRVPADKFEQTLAELRKLAVRVTSESTSSKDVTEEYVDLQSRLRNAEATEKQHLALLQKAQTVDETLRIYNSLSQVRGQIEQIKGRMQVLERTTSMSLITVRLEPAAITGPLVRAGWSALHVLVSAVRGLVIAGQILGSIVIWLIIFSPLWGAILAIIRWRRAILGIILWRRRKKSA